MYGKLDGGRFIKAKHFIITDRETIINPTGDMYERHGYKRLKEDALPELTDSQALKAFYEETEAEILKHYKVVEIDEDIY